MSLFKRHRFQFTISDIIEDDDILEELLDDNEYEQNMVIHGGSRPGKRPNLNRDFASGHRNILNDYFVENPVYPENLFRRRFRMSKRLFKRIHDEVPQCTPFLRQRKDALGKQGPSSLQKITASLRLLAYGIAADAIDEYCRISESLVNECLTAFVEGVINLYGSIYLRAPTPADISKIQKMNSDLGWPGQTFSIDVMHWEWKNCPKAYAGLSSILVVCFSKKVDKTLSLGQYSGKEKGLPTMGLEAIVGPDAHIWWATFGYPGTLNDLTILDRSPLIQDIIDGRIRCDPYQINGETFDEYYLLTDGIYPEWSCFVKSFKQPDTQKKKHFAQVQEAKRKEVERTFGILQGRFNILSVPGRSWSSMNMKKIVKACVILHNMIIDDQRDEFSIDSHSKFIDGLKNGSAVENLSMMPRRLQEFRSPAPPSSIASICQNLKSVKNKESNAALRQALIEHQWITEGGQSLDD